MSKNKNNSSDSKNNNEENKNKKNIFQKLKLFISETPKDRLFLIFNLIIILLYFVAMAVSSIALSFVLKEEAQRVENLDLKSYSSLVSEIKNKNVSEIIQNNERLEVKFLDGEVENFQKVPTDSSQIEALKAITDFEVGNGEGEIKWDIQKDKDFEVPFWAEIFKFEYISFFILLSFLFWSTYYSLKAMSSQVEKLENKLKLEKKDKPEKTKFSEVIGMEVEKEEVIETIDFLKNPSKFAKMGVKVPSGILLHGKPGNGKTLLAKAIAGEAGVPFFFASGSEFNSVFRGGSAERIREIFKQAKKAGKAVLFIDEIDAIAKKRDSGSINSDTEAINELLVQLDGMESRDGIVVVSATNLIENLDSAILRPGRFDRKVEVKNPRQKDRIELFKFYTAKKPAQKNIDFLELARRASGFSAAEIANIVNEAGILALRSKKKKISDFELREAIEKTMVGLGSNDKISDSTKNLIATHEAGHALLATILPDSDKVNKVTIRGRGGAGGYVFHAPKEDSIIESKEKLYSDMLVSLGGYIAEEVFLGTVSTGAGGDFQKVRNIAQTMISSGMFGGPKMIFLKQDSKEMASQASKLVEKAYKEAKKLIKKHKKELEGIRNYLLQYESIEFEDFQNLSKSYENIAKIKI